MTLIIGKEKSSVKALKKKKSHDLSIRLIGFQNIWLEIAVQKP
jgi:hypothetical protein